MPRCQARWCRQFTTFHHLAATCPMAQTTSTPMHGLPASSCARRTSRPTRRRRCPRAAHAPPRGGVRRDARAPSSSGLAASRTASRSARPAPAGRVVGFLVAIYAEAAVASAASAGCSATRRGHASDPRRRRRRPPRSTRLRDAGRSTTCAIRRAGRPHLLRALLRVAPAARREARAAPLPRVPALRRRLRPPRGVFGRCIAGPNPREPGFLWRGNRRFFVAIIGTGQLAFLTTVAATVAGAAVSYS